MENLPELIKLKASLQEAAHALSEIRAKIKDQIQSLTPCPSPPRTGLYLTSGSRLAVHESDYLRGWYVGHSPRNDSYCAEGTWEEWVDLAHKILEEDKRRGAIHS